MLSIHSCTVTIFSSELMLIAYLTKKKSFQAKRMQYSSVKTVFAICKFQMSMFFLFLFSSSVTFNILLSTCCVNRKMYLYTEDICPKTLIIQKKKKSLSVSFQKEEGKKDI